MEREGAGFGPVVHQEDPENFWNVNSDAEPPTASSPSCEGETKHNLGDSEAQASQALTLTLESQAGDVCGEGGGEMGWGGVAGMQGVYVGRSCYADLDSGVRAGGWRV